MIKRQELFGKVCDTLGALTFSIRMRSAGGDLGVNHAAEDFYCGFLNILLSKPAQKFNLHNMNAIHSDFPAIDLGDEENKLAVQVTTTEHRDKVNHTLNKFFEKNLDQTYNRLIVLVIGKKDEFKKDFSLKRNFDFVHTRDVWDLDKLGKELSNLNQQKLEELDKYLTDALTRVPPNERSLRLKFPSVLDQDAFIGRETELEMLEKKINDGSNAPIVLYGLGGMGKTTLVARFCADYECGNVYYVRFRDSFTQTVALGVASGMQGYSDRKPDAVRDYTEAMDRLRMCDKNDILVIDNADAPDGMFSELQKDPAYHELRELDLRLIITTRCAVDRAIEVGAMKKERLHDIFFKHGLHLQTNEMNDLIETVRGHTMTVDLIARTLKWNRRLTVAQLLEVMRDGTLADQNFRPVSTDRNGDVEQEQIYEHLRKLFNVSKISGAGKMLLRYAVLLPEDGMALKLFDAALPIEIRNILEKQIDLGWLGYERDTGFVTIHPVIRMVCRKELTPTDQTCKDFLWSLFKQYRPKQYEISQIWQLADCMSRAADLLEDDWGDWSYYAALLWDEVGQTHVALQYAEQSIARRQVRVNQRTNPEIRAKRSLKLASSYNIASQACAYGGIHEQAMIYGEKALKLRKKYLPVKHRQIAASYNNLGMIYSHLKLYQKSMDYLWIAVRIREAQEEPRQDEIANSYNNIGTVYNSMEKYGKALKYREKALQIRRELFADDPNNPDLVASINNVGRTLHALKRYDEALALELEALHIRESILHESDWELANSYYNVGHTYGAMGNYQEAIRYLEKALGTWEKGQATDNIYFAPTQEEAEEYRSHLEPQYS